MRTARETFKDPSFLRVFWSKIARLRTEMRPPFILPALSFSCMVNGLYAEEKQDFVAQQIERLSFYRGYFLGRDSTMKFDKIIEDTKAGIAGEAINRSL